MTDIHAQNRWFLWLYCFHRSLTVKGKPKYSWIGGWDGESELGISIFNKLIINPKQWSGWGGVKGSEGVRKKHIMPASTRWQEPSNRHRFLDIRHFPVGSISYRCQYEGICYLGYDVILHFKVEKLRSWLLVCLDGLRDCHNAPNETLIMMNIQFVFLIHYNRESVQS